MDDEFCNLFRLRIIYLKSLRIGRIIRDDYKMNYFELIYVHASLHILKSFFSFF